MPTVQNPNPSNPADEGPLSSQNDRSVTPPAAWLPRLEDPKAWRRACLLLVVAASTLYGARLGAIDFWAPDEPRYGAIAEEIRSFRHGPEGLVLLHLNDSPYTQKPPLYFWLAALVGAPLGHVSEWAARLPSAIAAVASLLLTAALGRRLLLEPRTAWLAAALLATSFRFAFTARRAQLDVLLTLFELVAVAIFVHLEFKQNAFRSDLKPRKGAVALLHAALGLGALVKGPVAWLPLAIFWAYLALDGRGGMIRRILPLWAFALSIGPVVAWILAAIAMAPAGFAEIAVGENLVGRFFSGTSHARPFYYFFLQTPADFLPWTLLLPFAIQPIRAGLTRSDPAIRFLVVWFLVPLFFFSLSAGKRGVYLLPFFPPLAMMASLALRALIQRRDRALQIVLAVALIELLAFTLILPNGRLRAEKSPRPIAVAAAAHSRPEQPIGLFELHPLIGPIGYYGHRTAAPLQGESELRAHFRDPEAIALLRIRHFEQWSGPLGLREIQRFRSGKRMLVLAGSKFDAPKETSLGITP